MCPCAATSAHPSTRHRLSKGMCRKCPGDLRATGSRNMISRSSGHRRQEKKNRTNHGFNLYKLVIIVAICLKSLLSLFKYVLREGHSDRNYQGVAAEEIMPCSFQQIKG